MTRSPGEAEVEDVRVEAGLAGSRQGRLAAGAVARALIVLASLVLVAAACGQKLSEGEARLIATSLFENAYRDAPGHLEDIQIVSVTPPGASGTWRVEITARLVESGAPATDARAVVEINQRSGSGRIVDQGSRQSLA